MAPKIIFKKNVEKKMGKSKKTAAKKKLQKGSPLSVIEKGLTGEMKALQQEAASDEAIQVPEHDFN